HGTRRSAFRSVDRYVYERVRDFLARRHKVAGRGTRRFSCDVVYGERGLLRLERLPLTAALCASPGNQSESRMPGIGPSGWMSGDGKPSVAEWPKLSRPSSTLPTRTSRDVRAMSVIEGKSDVQRIVAKGRDCEGFRMPAVRKRWGGLRRPASENLQGRK